MSKKKKKKQQRKESRKYMARAKESGVHVPDWQEIKGYFTPDEAFCMREQSSREIDLEDCESVLRNAQKIWQRVATGDMPPGGPQWTAEKVNGFYKWWKSNPECP